MNNALHTYLASIEKDYKGGKATEHTYRPALERLLESLAPHIEASNDPKHIKCGAPDFIVERKHVPLGYVETKDIGDDLNKTEKSEQLKRYRASLNNLILTDYLEFRWYVGDKLRMTTRLASVGKGKKIVPDADGIAQTEQLFAAFYATEVPTVNTPKELAQRMAALTKIVRDLIQNALTTEDDIADPKNDKSIGVFHQQLQAFKEYLLPELKPEEFADLYAQTMAYGLFAAAASKPAGKPFSRAEAYMYLPQANPFLRKLFLDVGEELDGTLIAPFLDDLAALLARADMSAILQDFGKKTKTEDPVVHFYETFLAAYDPKLRETRGVYYTPEPVVQFIVNSVDQLLKTKFNRPQGLADPNTMILDPATGTGTFLYFVIRKIYEAQVARGQQGAWKDYVHSKLLPRLFAFELLMAPYAVAHLKLGLLLSELGYTFEKKERLGVYLTNALDEGVSQDQTFGLAGYLAQEGSEAAEVKNNNPIMVVVGNPPYSGHSKNPTEVKLQLLKGQSYIASWQPHPITGKPQNIVKTQAEDGPRMQPTFIGKLMWDYFVCDGKLLGERNPKWLQDDYVKFIRFAQWRIDQTGQGIVAFITNHGYLDNPTFRGMRQSLMKTFDTLYVLDLHGNSKKRETAPDGGKDENVFDIQQGVAIVLAVKRPATSPVSEPCEVLHAELFGTRAVKYPALGSNDCTTLQWHSLQPAAPSYLFVRQNSELKKDYETFWAAENIFNENVLGFQTHRDPIAIAFNEAELRTQIKNFLGKYPSQIEWNKFCRRCDYRPFDKRFVFMGKNVTDRPRLSVMTHLFEPNLALNLPRQTKSPTWQHALVSNSPTPAVFVEIKDGSSVFPLYLYTTPESTEGTLFAQTEATRQANLSPQFIQAFSAKLNLSFVPDGKGDLKKTFGPEDIFQYAYAVFHSPTYRSRYAEFLKIDFPRLPLTSDATLFAALVQLGQELVALHLMKSPKLDDFITTFPQAGDNTVDKLSYEGGNVRFNPTQYFGHVPEAVFNFKVGGYQVCKKWLEDRKGRTLNSDDINHYQHIVVALNETMRLMREVDMAIGEFPIK